MIVDTLGWLGVFGAAIGLALSFTRYEQTALACIAWASMSLGMSFVLDSLRLVNIAFAAVCWAVSAVCVVVASIKERKNDAWEEVEQGQVHGEGAEGARD